MACEHMTVDAHGQACCFLVSCCDGCWLIVLFLFQTSFSRGFTKNMKLEAVNPRNPGELCVASVVSVKGRLMWLHLEGMHRQLSLGRNVGASENGRLSLGSAPLTSLLFQPILNYSVFLNK